MLRRSNVLLISLAAASSILFAACGPKPVPQPPLTRAECGEAKAYKYCLYFDASPKRSEVVLYYMHAGGENEHSWGRWILAEQMARRFHDQGLGAPTVVSISFGKQWLLTERGTTVGAGLLERFVEDAMPAMEIKTGRPRHRLLWGLSLGGFNAAQLLLKRAYLWHAAVLSCPAVLPLGPTSTPAERRSFLDRTGASADKVDWFLARAKRAFPNRAAWDRHDPLRLALEASEVPPTLIECGDADEWGFYEGSRQLSEVLSGQGQRVRFDTISKGRHCSVDADQVLGFLLTAVKS